MPRKSTKRQITVRPPERTVKIVEAVAKAEGIPAAEKMAEYLRRYVNELVMKGEIDPKLLEGLEEESDFEVLKGFVNCLLNTGGYDGYSLADIAEILGRKSEKILVEFFENCKKGNGD